MSTAEAANASAKAITFLPVRSFNAGVNTTGKAIAHISGHVAPKSELVVKASAEQFNEASDSSLALFLALAIYPVFAYRDGFTGGGSLTIV